LRGIRRERGRGRGRVGNPEPRVLVTEGPGEALEMRAVKRLELEE